MKAIIDQSKPDTTFVYYFRDAQGNVMGIYEQETDTVSWREQHLYESSRLGIVSPDVDWYVGDSHADSAYYITHPVLSEGCKQYELTDHLGNVRTVLSDRRQSIDSTGNSEADFFQAVVLAANDYYPFGQRLPSRTYQSGDYRYGFNGKEKDENEEWGDLTHYDYGFRIYNPPAGRFLSVDPLAAKYAAHSPYHYTLNNPIRFIDPDGRSVEDPTFRNNKSGKYYKSYQAFAATRNGSAFLARFSSSSNKTTLTSLKDCAGGDLQDHTLRLQVRDNEEMQNPGTTRVYLITSSGIKGLSSVTSDDIANSKLKFLFQIDIKQAYAEELEDGSVILGHEAFVHAEKYADAISSLLTEIETGDLSNEAIASRLKEIKMARGKIGKSDHEEYVKGKNKSVENYFEELLKSNKTNSNSIQKSITDDKDKY